MVVMGTGEITNGAVHIHAAMAIEGDQAVAGHLHRAEIRTFFGRAYIISADAAAHPGGGTHPTTVQ